MLKGTNFLGGLVLSCLIFSVAEAEQIRYDKGNRRDPFEPLIGVAGVRGGIGLGKEAFLLEGLVYDPKKGSYAVIGGEIYREGESVNGAELMEVLPDRAVLLQESSEIVIWLHEEIWESGQTKPKTNEKK